jgi:hypothetical protein
MALDCCHGFLISRVPNIRHIMHLMQNHKFQILDIRCINYVFVQKYVMIPSQILSWNH